MKWIPNTNPILYRYIMIICSWVKFHLQMVSNLLRLALDVHLLDILKDSDQSEVSNWNQFNFYKIQSSPVHLVEVQLIMSKYY